MRIVSTTGCVSILLLSKYYCILVILSTLTSFLCDFLFKNKVRSRYGSIVCELHSPLTLVLLHSWDAVVGGHGNGLKVLDTFCLIDGQRSSAKKQV